MDGVTVTTVNQWNKLNQLFGNMILFNILLLFYFLSLSCIYIYILLYIIYLYLYESECDDYIIYSFMSMLLYFNTLL